MRSFLCVVAVAVVGSACSGSPTESFADPRPEAGSEAAPIGDPASDGGADAPAWPLEAATGVQDGSIDADADGPPEASQPDPTCMRADTSAYPSAWAQCGAAWYQAGATGTAGLYVCPIDPRTDAAVPIGYGSPSSRHTWCATNCGALSGCADVDGGVSTFGVPDGGGAIDCCDVPQ